MKIEVLTGPQNLPAQLPIPQGRDQVGFSIQMAAGQKLPHLIAETEAKVIPVLGDSPVLYQTHGFILVRAAGKLHLAQQCAAQKGILRGHQLRLGIQPGAELPVDQDKASDGAGQGRNGHHAAKQLPEKAHRPHPPNR